MDVFTINQTVRSLVEDPDGDYTTDAYLQGPLNLCYTELANRLRLCNPDFDEYVVELPNVPAGTRDLSAYAKKGQPLEFLLDAPRRIEWKLVGQDPVYYEPAEGPLNKVRELLAPGISALDDYAWTHLTIYLSLFNVNLDLRIAGEFMFPPLTTNDQTTLVGLNALPAMAYSIAQVIAMKRGNPQWVQQYGLKAEENFDTLNIGMCKGRQAKTERAGRIDRQRSWYGPGGNLIG
ncbi:MAG TPA: hypothetical protein VKZ53_27150 [Candidatus Angelobacter sp.]|nr:hypothetical protein [Candidatus Angelobacter sp.]